MQFAWTATICYWQLLYSHIFTWEQSERQHPLMRMTVTVVTELLWNFWLVCTRWPWKRMSWQVPWVCLLHLVWVKPTACKVTLLRPLLRCPPGFLMVLSGWPCLRVHYCYGLAYSRQPDFCAFVSPIDDLTHKGTLPITRASYPTHWPRVLHPCPTWEVHSASFPVRLLALCDITLFCLPTCLVTGKG